MESLQTDVLEPESVQAQLAQDEPDDDDGDTEMLTEDDSQKESPGAIKPIERKVIHRICSGQVIVTLATAIKELVENSIDAHATSVDIHLIECGSLEIQVIDNGVGVNESNFEALTKKHCTSKLSQFEDLTSIGTFGFRGEALSSLCALAELSVTTRTKEAKTAYRIEYDSNGKIITQTPCARAVGTTVTLRNLFQPLPVRHREFMKNLKREYTKMVNFLYGYCLICKGVRINLTNEESKGDVSKQVLCVPPLDAVRERLVSIFGSKQVSSLVEVSEATIPQEVPASILQEYGLSQSQFASKPYSLEGFVSKPHNGRSANDRQFLFINSRPFESAKIMKIINEVYHSYSSRNQYPFVVLNIFTNQDNVDVNVSPDKRSIYLQNEKLLYSTVKATLATLLSSASSRFHTNSSLKDGSGQESFPASAGSESQSPTLKKLSTQQHSAPTQSNSTFSPQFSGVPSLQTFNPRSLLSKFRVGNRNLDLLSQSNASQSQSQSGFQSTSSQSSERRGHAKDLIRFRNGKQPKLLDFLSSQKSSKIRKLDSESVLSAGVDSDSGSDEVETVAIVPDSIIEDMSHSQSQQSQDSVLTTCEYFLDEDDDANGSQSQLDLDAELECNISTSKVMLGTEMSDPEPDEGIATNTPLSPPLSPIISSQSSRANWPGHEFLDSEENNEVIILYDDELGSGYDSPRKVHQEGRGYDPGPTVKLKLDLEQLRNKLTQLQKLKSDDSNLNVCRARKFRAKFTDNNAAEQELKKELSLDMFKQLEILGQFNLGFIIGRHDADLFIIDQHASDEKYNFESLEKSLVLQNQKLICPKLLELPAISENVLIDNLDVFRKNGFDFEIDENGTPTSRIKLTSIPHSKSYEFGREDIEELIFMLEDAPEKSFCRPTKVRTMLASRACRKSVMIGTALGAKEMSNIVQHMAELDQPWNCPHGRPTLRHLFNLNLMTDLEKLHFN